MRCRNCEAENLEGSTYCKECGAPLEEAVTQAEETRQPTKPEAPEGAEPTAREEVEPTILARFLSTAWKRRGPILMAFAIVLMMAMVFAPWAFIRIEVLGLSLVSRSFSGWDIIVARILFFLLIIPLVISIMMVAGIGTRRRVIETHIITFFLGFLLIIWGATFGLSLLLKSLIKNLKVVQVIPAGAQVATLIFLIVLVAGIIFTTYDRGRQLLAMGEGG